MRRLRHIIGGVAGCCGRRLWLLLWALGMLSVADIPGSPIFVLSRAEQWGYIVAAGALKASVLGVPLGLMMRRRPWRPAAVAVIAVYGLLAVVNALCYRFYEFGITRKLLMILSQTTSREASEFVPALLANLRGLLSAPSTYVVAASALAVCVAMLRMPRRAAVAVAAALPLAGDVSFAAFSMSYIAGRTAHSLVVRTAKYIVEARREQQRYAQMQQGHVAPLPRAGSIAAEGDVAVVVVIGESASRDHLSLYGYALPTSPRLDAMRDSLYVFTDAIGSSSCTAGNMERILTFKEDDATEGDALSYPGVIDVFKAAGYRTWWLSNQERVGMFSNISGVLAERADEVRFVGADNSEDALALRYDDALLPDFAAAMDAGDARRLVFMHLMGSHTHYDARYPGDFARFGAADEMRLGLPWLDGRTGAIRAAYDNSILYTDHLLAGIVGRLAREPRPAVMVYFSDHGENVYDEGPYTGRGRAYVRVPFVVYANAAYRRSRPDMAGRLAAAVGRPLSTANVVYMLMTLTGTRYAMYDGADDPLSDDFTPRPRMVDEQPWD